VKQKTRKQAQEKQDFIIQEIEKLKKAKLIREVAHPTWIANPMVVPTANGSGRLGVDFTSLHKACPKDPYPLPRIDQIIDSTDGCDLLCFLDAFSGYHQIKMAREDKEKTAFITPCGVYCYVCMPFSLKNAGATFQRLMCKALGAQMGRNAEAYIDNIVVKTRESHTFIEDLEETFANLGKVNIKLNPAKCTFGVPSGKLLGFLVSHHGIEANPDKVKAIEEMHPPRNLKEMQRLTGCMAALGRFIARSGEKALPSCDLAFIAAAFRGDRTYNLGALIAFHLDANHEKGGICGGLIASRLLALHGLVPHVLDFQFPVERLDLNSMIHHKFVSSHACLTNLTFEITFFKKSTWKVVKTNRSVHLPAPLLFNLDRRNGWSLIEGELDAYLEEHPLPVHDGEATEESVQPSNIAEFPYQQLYYDYTPSASSS
jgi:hypothetical protein